MPGIDITRAQRWFRLLLLTAVLAMGTLYQALHSPSGAGAALLLFLSSITLAASTLQATRVWRALRGAPRTLQLPRASHR